MKLLIFFTLLFASLALFACASHVKPPPAPPPLTCVDAAKLDVSHCY